MARAEGLLPLSNFRDKCLPGPLEDSGKHSCTDAGSPFGPSPVSLLLGASRELSRSRCG